MKEVYQLPFNQSGDYVTALLFPRKHKIILEKQRELNSHFGDKRRINGLMQYKNSNNETYIFAKYGVGENETIVTVGQILGGRWLKIQKI